MLFNAASSIPRAEATDLMSRPKLFNRSRKSISSPRSSQDYLRLPILLKVETAYYLTKIYKANVAKKT